MFVCCDHRRAWMIYIGLPGGPDPGPRYNPVPHGTARLPASIVTLYDQIMEALAEAVSKGASAEDTSKGYSLSADPAVRSRQLAMLEYAEHSEPLLIRVLASSSEAEHRQVAAYALGYSPRSKPQVDALVRACRDRDETVRNNAVRSLAALAAAGPKGGPLVPAAPFVDMLTSGVWTDRNKSSALLLTMSQSRDPRLLTLLRDRAVSSLLEMARWRYSGHANPARILLGRVAGIEEGRLQQLARDGDVDGIVGALH